jgi:hypothetical protein
MIGTGVIQRNQVELGGGGGVHADEPPPLVFGEQGVGKLARHNRRWVRGSKHEHQKNSIEAGTVGAALSWTTSTVSAKAPAAEGMRARGTTI